MTEVVCFVGTSKIYITKIDQRGNITKDNLKSIEPDGRIVKICNDRWLKKGTLLLTDSSSETFIPEFKVVNECKLLQLQPLKKKGE